MFTVEIRVQIVLMDVGEIGVVLTVVRFTMLTFRRYIFLAQRLIGLEALLPNPALLRLLLRLTAALLVLLVLIVAPFALLLLLLLLTLLVLL